MRQVFISIIVLSAVAMLLTQCTISFQNISTHGTATDLVDQDQKATSDLKNDVTVPLKAI